MTAGIDTITTTTPMLSQASLSDMAVKAWPRTSRVIDIAVQAATAASRPAEITSSRVTVTMECLPATTAPRDGRKAAMSANSGMPKSGAVCSIR
jgi:ABC-type Fe2+-enterobactin transport system substrate-binding protein